MTMRPEDARLPLSEQLDKLPESEIVRKLREEYYRTGTYSVEDLHRILGDPTRIVEITTEGNFTFSNLISS